MAGRRRVLSRVESAELFEQRMRQKRDAMSPAEIDALMRKVIDQRMDECGAVTRDDLLRANVPAPAIDMHFRTVVREVVQARIRRGICA